MATIMGQLFLSHVPLVHQGNISKEMIFSILVTCLLNNASRYFKAKLDIDHLDGFGSFHGLLWRNSNFTLTKKLLYKEGDVTASNWDVLYTTANDITLSLKKEQN